MSLIGLVPEHLVMDPAAKGADGGPVLVQVTVCPAHVRPVRRWLRARMLPQDEPMTLGTEYLLRHWGQIVESAEVPVFAPSIAAGA